MNKSTHFMQDDQALSAESPDGFVVLQIDIGRYYCLKGVGNAIWQVLEEPVSRDDIVHAITDRYSVSNEQCAADVDRFLADLIEAKLIIEN